jgi:hypothetical protein
MQLTAAEDELRTTKGTVATLHGRIDALTAENARQSLALAEANAAVARIRAEKDALAARIVAQTAEIDGVRQSGAALTAQVEEERSQKNLAKAKVAALESTKTRMEEDANSLLVELTRLRAANTGSIDEESNKRRRAEGDLQTARQQHNEQMDTLRREKTTEIGLIQAELDRIRRTHTADLERINREHSTELDRINREHSAEITRINRDHTAEVGRIQSDLARSRTEATALTAERNQLAAQLVALQAEKAHNETRGVAIIQDQDRGHRLNHNNLAWNAQGLFSACGRLFNQLQMLMKVCNRIAYGLAQTTEVITNAGLPLPADNTNLEEHIRSIDQIVALRINDATQFPQELAFMGQPDMASLANHDLYPRSALFLTARFHNPLRNRGPLALVMQPPARPEARVRGGGGQAADDTEPGDWWVVTGLSPATGAWITAMDTIGNRGQAANIQAV